MVIIVLDEIGMRRPRRWCSPVSEVVFASTSQLYCNHV